MNQKPKFVLLTTALSIGVVLIIGGLALSKFLSIRKAMASGGPPEAPETVVLVKPVETDWQPLISTTGTVVATQSVMLSNEMAGTVNKIDLEPGKVVEAGQVLVQLDTNVEEAQLKAAQARRKLSQLSLDRVVRAAERDAVSPNELDQARATFEESVARIEELQALIDRKTLKAPFKSVVGISDVHLGQYLPEGASIASLQGVADQVYLDFSLPQELASRLPVGTPLSVRADGMEIMANLTSTDSRVSDQTRSKRTRATINSADSSVKPGMAVTVRVPVALPRKVLTVPAIAIRRAAWGDYVYIAAPNDKGELRVKQASVTLGSSIGENVIVESGLTGGETVVADGSFKLRDGAWVAPGAAPAAAPVVPVSTANTSTGTSPDQSAPAPAPSTAPVNGANSSY